MEYYINKVKKDINDNIIEVNIKNLGVLSLKDCIELIQKGNQFFTLYFENGKEIKGAKILIDRGFGKAYLTTYPNHNDKDNLDNLPSI